MIVAYWYEVGDYTMYERQDLLGTQWAMFGKTKWPVMFKVLLEMPADEADQSKSRNPGHGPIRSAVAGSMSSPCWTESLRR